MKAEEEDFYSQFQNKQVSEFSVVKQTPSSDSEIEAITGSTITSKAMANGCNAAIYYFQNALGGAQ
jgi:electron transport complex protein RnfG